MLRTLELIDKLQPQSVVLENVLGLLHQLQDESSNAYDYVKGQLSRSGYNIVTFRCDAMPWIKTSRPRPEEWVRNRASKSLSYPQTQPIVDLELEESKSPSCNPLQSLGTALRVVWLSWVLSFARLYIVASLGKSVDLARTTEIMNSILEHRKQWAAPTDPFDILLEDAAASEMIKQEACGCIGKQSVELQSAFVGRSYVKKPLPRSCSQKMLLQSLAKKMTSAMQANIQKRGLYELKMN